MKPIIFLFQLTILVFLITLACQRKSGSISSDPQNVEQAFQECIQNILTKDDSLGAIRNHACEQISLSETINQYISSLRELNYNACPKEFTNAFYQHQEAWLRMVPLVDQYPDLRGEMHDLFDTIEDGKDGETFKPLLKDIWDTWGLVEDAKTLN